MYAAVTESKPNISALNTKKGYLLLFVFICIKFLHDAGKLDRINLDSIEYVLFIFL